jgi:uncharacterized membrane protein
VILVLIGWYTMTVAFPLADLDALSPAYLSQQVTTIMAGGWNGTLWAMAGGFIAMILVFVAMTVYYFEGKDLVGE